MPDAALVPARLVRGARGAVVAPHHLATAAGLAVLAAGGHAVDAAIATNAVLGVVMPNGCGIGGDAFWLVWDEAAGEQVALNGSGRSPAGVDAAGLCARGLDRIPLRGPLAITVPGAVRSWADAHRRWGRLSRDTVLAAAIEHAAAGFPAWAGLVSAVEGTAANLGREPWTDGFRSVWRPEGRPWRPGEVIRLAALAATLRTLAIDGFDAYYDGELGERIASGLQDLHHVPGRPGHDAPAQQQRRPRARDPQRPGAVRATAGCQVHRSRLVGRRLAAPPARGRQARLRGS
jgi:gamma-glutamyltranspeptidase